MTSEKNSKEKQIFKILSDLFVLVKDEPAIMEYFMIIKRIWSLPNHVFELLIERSIKKGYLLPANDLLWMVDRELEGPWRHDGNKWLEAYTWRKWFSKQLQSDDLTSERNVPRHLSTPGNSPKLLDFQIEELPTSVALPVSVINTGRLSDNIILWLVSYTGHQVLKTLATSLAASVISMDLTDVDLMASVLDTLFDSPEDAPSEQRPATRILNAVWELRKPGITAWRDLLAISGELFPAAQEEMTSPLFDVVRLETCLKASKDSWFQEDFDNAAALISVLEPDLMSRLSNSDRYSVESVVSALRRLLECSLPVLRKLRIYWWDQDKGLILLRGTHPVPVVDFPNTGNVISITRKYGYSAQYDNTVVPLYDLQTSDDNNVLLEYENKGILQLLRNKAGSIKLAFQESSKDTPDMPVYFIQEMLLSLADTVWNMLHKDDITALFMDFFSNGETQRVCTVLSSGSYLTQALEALLTMKNGGIHTKTLVDACIKSGTKEGLKVLYEMLLSFYDKDEPEVGLALTSKILELLGKPGTRGKQMKTSLILMMAYYIKGKIERQASDYESAINDFEQAIKNGKVLSAEWWDDTGRLRWGMSNSTMQTYRYLHDDNEEDEDRLHVMFLGLMLKFYIEMGEALFMNDQEEKVLETCEKAIELHSFWPPTEAEEDANAMKAYIHFLQAQSLVYLHRYQESLGHIQIAKDIFEKLVKEEDLTSFSETISHSYGWVLASSYIMEGYSERYLYHYDQAVHAYQKAIDYLKEMQEETGNYTNELGDAYYGCGSTLYMDDRYDRAEECLKRGLSVLNGEDDLEQAAQVIITNIKWLLGDVLEERNRPRQALTWFRRAVNFFEDRLTMDKDTEFLTNFMDLMDDIISLVVRLGMTYDVHKEQERIVGVIHALGDIRQLDKENMASVHTALEKIGYKITEADYPLEQGIERLIDLTQVY